MAITDVINGTDVLVFISPHSGTTTWKAVAHATTHSLSIKMATRDTSNKGTSNYVTKGNGRLDVSGSLSGMYIDTDTYNLADFQALIIAREPVMMIFGRDTGTANVPDTTTSGGVHFYSSGEFYITSVDAEFPDQANCTYSVTFEHSTGFAINHLFVS